MNKKMNEDHKRSMFGFDEKKPETKPTYQIYEPMLSVFEEPIPE
jgi:hypothetical protein